MQIQTLEKESIRRIVNLFSDLIVGCFSGELFAIRTALYRHFEKDTLFDDFIISLRVEQDVYTIQYDP